ncbi:MFS transporter [Planosporangium flavigriseum]|uniref:MFS transporter n=1 Tax=Planosporangium flavigriseum TaxID=373681 RepID=A0A8J3LKN9_9ACTN|nr:MFS transporter [Planosporangium flavigriseum]NJC67402.1 MFS transporter [Planosporangium flavigriseum]GIG74963.1 MFS transporter [Planosporangium flavigriseum]
MSGTGRLAQFRAALRGPEDRRQQLLARATIVNTVGMGMFLSAGTIFLIKFTGLSPAAVGAGLTVGSLIGVGAGVLIGDLADRRGSREVVIAAMLLEAVGSICLLLVDNLWTLIAVAAVASVGSGGTGSARGAMIGVLAEAGKGARLRSYLRAVTNVGLAIGTLSAAVALSIDTRPAYLFLIVTDTVTFLLSAAILSRLPHLPPTRVAKIDDSAKAERKWVALRDRHYLGLTVASSVASLQYWVLVQALPVWIVFKTDAPRSMAALVLFIASIAVAAMQMPATRSIDGPQSAARLITLSGPVFLVAWFMMALSAGPAAWIAIVLLLFGVLVHSLAEVWQAGGTFELSFALAQPEAQGQYQGVMGLGHSIAAAVAPVIVITLCVNGGIYGWVALALVVSIAGFVCALVERHWARSRAVPSNQEMQSRTAHPASP